MTYKINTTNGNILAEVADGLLDVNSCSLTLIGKNSVNFGESVNENFVKLLENFASSVAPVKAIKGQIWYNTSTGRLNVYDGVNFRSTGTPIVSPQQPASLIAGDIWIDTANRQLKFYDGNSLVLAGPAYTQTQGVSGTKVISVTDKFGKSKTIVLMYVSNVVVGWLSKETFELGVDVSEMSLSRGTVINTGFTASVLDGFKIYATATGAETIVVDENVVKTPDQIAFVDEDVAFTENFAVQNDLGLSIGSDAQVKLHILNNDFIIESNKGGSSPLDIAVKIKNSSNLTTEALTVNAARTNIGIFNNNPDSAYKVDIGGSVRISGDLVVNGATTTINSTVFTVDDINIVLGSTSTPTDLTAVGGGITLKGNTDKTITWTSTSGGWVSNQTFDLSNSSHVYKIGNVPVLSQNILKSSVTVAEGLVELQSTLQYLNVDNLRLDGNTVSSTNINGNIVLNANGTGAVDVSNAFIINVKTTTAATPVQDAVISSIEDIEKTATNKTYVDTITYTKSLAMTLDVTGMLQESYDPGESINTKIAELLDILMPVFDSQSADINEQTGVALNGTKLRLHCTATKIYNTELIIGTANIDTDPILVTPAAGGAAVPVVQDGFAIEPFEGSKAQITVLRQNKIFVMNNGHWTFVDNIGSAYQTVYSGNNPLWPASADLG